MMDANSGENSAEKLLYCRCEAKTYSSANAEGKDPEDGPIPDPAQHHPNFVKAMRSR